MRRPPDPRRVFLLKILLPSFLATCLTAGLPATVSGQDLQHPVYRFTMPASIPESRTVPEYPQASQEAGVGARIMFSLVISKTGTVRNLSPVKVELLDAATCRPPDPADSSGRSPDPNLSSELESSAKEAVSAWRYLPALQDGVPVEVFWIESVTICTGGVTASPPASPHAKGPAEPTPKESEEGVTEPRAISESAIPPHFPERGRIRGVGAQVILEVVVSETGKARDFEVVETRALDPVACEPADDGRWERKMSFPPSVAGDFEREAWLAVQKWAFRPALRNGNPVEGRTRVTVDFCVGPMARWLL